MRWTNRITEAVNVRINNKIAWRLRSAEAVEYRMVEGRRESGFRKVSSRQEIIVDMIT
jgi:hypothetical protein